MADVFISYSKADRDLTKTAAKIIGDKGYSVWWDQNLISGDDFSEVIVNQINTAKAVVVIWTSNSKSSKWVRSEAKRATQLGKFVPMRAPSLSTDEIPPPYDNYHTPTLDQEDALVSAVARLAGERYRKPSRATGTWKFVDWNKHDPTFYGMLVLPSFRAWLVVNAPSTLVPGSVQLFDGVSILYNDEEIFRKRVRAANSFLEASRSEIERLAALLNTAITLIFPIAIDLNTYNRFVGSDRKYVFRKTFSPNEGQILTFGDRAIGGVGYRDAGWDVVPMPEDYLREAFGVEIQRTRRQGEKKALLTLKENSMARGAKYIVLESGTFRLAEISATDRELMSHDREITLVPGAKEALARAISERNITIRGSQGEIVETDLQRHRREAGEFVTCDYCKDESEVVVEVSSRRYRVPCPVCNFEKDKTWTAFFNTREAIADSGSGRIDLATTSRKVPIGTPPAGIAVLSSSRRESGLLEFLFSKFLR